MRSHVPQLRSTNTEHRAPPAPGRRPHTAVGSETAAGATRRGGPRAQPLQAASRLPAIAARALKHPAASPAPAPPPPPRGARLPAPAGALASTRRRRASGGGLFLRPSTAAAFVFSLLRSSRPFLRSRENPLCMGNDATWHAALTTALGRRARGPGGPVQRLLSGRSGPRTRPPWRSAARAAPWRRGRAAGCGGGEMLARV